METPPACPVEDCTIAVDLVLQSADGAQFGSHKLNLENYSDESADVLRLMLRFMHHVPQPDLDDVPFETVAALADAVEKYFIYSAMGMCKMYMMLHKDQHPVQVFAYACRNNHTDIANKTAPLTLDADAATMLKHVDASHVLKWFMYRELLLKKRNDMMAYTQPSAQLHKGGLDVCGLWEPFIEVEESSSIEKEMYRLLDCAHCTRRANHWKNRWVNLLGVSTVGKIPMFWDA